jgi:hypothetical protein
MGVVFDAALQMIIDGRKIDQLLFIPYTGEDQDSLDLDAALRDVIRTLALPYTEIDAEAGVDTWISN